MSKSPNNMSRQGWKADVIVCHITEGGFDGSVSWLCNPQAQASAHFVVGVDGRTEQLVDLDLASWCNGTSVTAGASRNYRNATARLVKERQTNANYFTYSIEHEGYSYKDRKGALTEPQYSATLEVMKKCINHMKSAYGITFNPDRDHLIGHYEVTPAEKPNCPAPAGTNFPFDRLLADIKKWMTPAPAPAPATAPAPAPAGPSGNLYNLNKNVPGYYSSSDAMNRTNAKVTVQKGSYFIFKQANGMINITSQKGSAGSWINPNDNVESTATAPTYPAISYTGNSIVDGLKSIGAPSDFDSLRRIAIKNGMNTFTGTANQNTTLLNKLKAGNLIKP
jgi:N-acetyl-anhydromuramyl-L-alanine amidase AmpD